MTQALDKSKISSYEKHPALKAIYESIRKERLQKWIVAMLIIPVSIFLITHFYQTDFLLVIIGLVGLSISVILVISLIQGGGLEKHPVYKILSEQPRDIVWVYSIKTQRLPFGISLFENTYLYFADTKSHLFSLKVRDKDIKIIMRKLNQWVPWASFGYSEQKELSYRENPNSLIKKEQQ